MRQMRQLGSRSGSISFQAQMISQERQTAIFCASKARRWLLLACYTERGNDGDGGSVPGRITSIQLVRAVGVKREANEFKHHSDFEPPLAA